MSARGRALLELGLVAALFCLAVGFVWFVSCGEPSITCKEKGDAMELESEWAFWSGCKVKVDGRWVLLENYRVSP